MFKPPYMFSSSPIPFQSKRTRLWWSNVACKNGTYLDIRVNFPRFLPNFNEIWIFRRPVGTALMRAGRRSDMTKLINAFRDYANAPSSVCVCARVRACVRVWPNWAACLHFAGHTACCGMWSVGICTTDAWILFHVTYLNTRPQSRPLWCKYRVAEVTKRSVASLTRRAHWLWT
jgi:hypothetical protein